MLESQSMIVHFSSVYESNSYVLIYIYEIISKIDFTNQIVRSKYMQKLIIFL